MTKLNTLQTELQDLYDQSEALSKTIHEACQKLMETRRDIILEKKLLAGRWEQWRNLPYFNLKGDWDKLAELHAVTHPKMGLYLIELAEGISLDICGHPELRFYDVETEAIREFLTENGIVATLGCCDVDKTTSPRKLREILSLFE